MTLSDGQVFDPLNVDFDFVGHHQVEDGEGLFFFAVVHRLVELVHEFAHLDCTLIYHKLNYKN